MKIENIKKNQSDMKNTVTEKNILQGSFWKMAVLVNTAHLLAQRHQDYN